MGYRILVLYGSYRTDRKGIRLAEFAMGRLRARGEDVELIDAKAIGLPMLDRMLKEYAAARRRQRWRASERRSARRTPSYSWLVSTTGACNPGLRT
jgi:NAD(P)H-dependent FMN reductase